MSVVKGFRLASHVRLVSRATRLGITAVVGCLVLSACGSSKSTSPSQSPSASASTSSRAAATPAPSAGSCGSTPTGRPVVDKTGILKSLGSAYVNAYNGYDIPVEASKWAHWSPKGKKFKVGVAFGPLVNGSQTSIYDHLVAALKASPAISSVVAYAASDLTVATQLQQYQSLVQQHVNLIIYEPAVSEAFVGPVSNAAAAGIPSVSINDHVNSPYSVNVTPNSYLFGAQGGAGLFALLKGEGNVLQVNGLPGTSLNTAADQGFTDALKLCSGIHVVGQLTGNFTPSVAQSATLTYLSSHPAPVAGVWEAGTMASGVVNAFTKLGRTVPPISASAVPQGFLAYWSSRAASGYRAYVLTESPGALAAITSDVAVRMLKGDGVRVNSIVLAPTLVTAHNLPSWVTTKDTQSDASSDGPPSVASQGEAYAGKLFRK